jgi:hypothetical protein
MMQVRNGPRLTKPRPHRYTRARTCAYCVVQAVYTRAGNSTIPAFMRLTN